MPTHFYGIDRTYLIGSQNKDSIVKVGEEHHGKAIVRIIEPAIDVVDPIQRWIPYLHAVNDYILIERECNPLKAAETVKP